MFQILATCSVEVDHLHSTPHLQVKRSYVYFLKTALCYLTALSCVRRLLFTQIWKPPLVPRPIPDSFGGRVCNVQLRFSKTQTTPDRSARLGSTSVDRNWGCSPPRQSPLSGPHQCPPHTSTQSQLLLCTTAAFPPTYSPFTAKTVSLCGLTRDCCH